MHTKEPDTLLEDRIFMSLDEIAEARKNGASNEDFLLGELHAYIDCLETILTSKGVSNNALLAIEEKYGLR